MSASNPPVSVAPPHLYAHGLPLELSSDKFGFLLESNPAEPPAILQERMDTDGYLYLREFWPRAQVQAVRDS